MLGGVPPPGSLSSVSWMLIAAFATDLTILGSIEYATRARAEDAGDALVPWAPVALADAGTDAAVPPPWAMCFVPTVPGEAARAAITYLHPRRDSQVSAREVLGWFGDLPPSAIEVWRLEDKKGERRVSFELPSSAWPGWAAVSAGKAGDALCDAMHADLRAHGVGRPRAAEDATATDHATRSRHDFELLSPRRGTMYKELVRMGTADGLTPERLQTLIDWLDAPPETP